MTPRPFRFGVNLLDASDREDWLATCARAEQLGYDVILVPDHLGMPAPFPALVAAASVTSRVRLGTFVRNTAFYTPAVLARDVAAVDQLVQGRLEVGLGTGYVRDEFVAAGVPYGSGAQRLDHLIATVQTLREQHADPAYRPAPAQHPVPLLLGGHGDRMLRLAARQADVVGFTAMSSDPDGRLTPVGADVLAERVAFARAAAGDRAAGIELNLLIQKVVLTDDRSVVLDQLRGQVAPEMDAATFGALPVVLCGAADEIAAHLREQRERLGISYLTVLGGDMEPFAEVLDLLRD